MSGNPTYRDLVGYPKANVNKRGWFSKGCNVLERECVPISGVGGRMSCRSCGSVSQSKFMGEIGIHFPGLKNIDKPIVWVFPEIVVCLDCGTAEFAVPEAELRRLAEGDATAAGMT
jgi:hypothetical protein